MKNVKADGWNETRERGPLVSIDKSLEAKDNNTIPFRDFRKILFEIVLAIDNGIDPVWPGEYEEFKEIKEIGRALEKFRKRDDEIDKILILGSMLDSVSHSLVLECGNSEIITEIRKAKRQAEEIARNLSRIR